MILILKLKLCPSLLGWMAYRLRYRGQITQLVLYSIYIYSVYIYTYIYVYIYIHIYIYVVYIYIYIYIYSALSPSLHQLVVRCWEEDVPQDMKDALVSTLYKNKGDKGSCDNYRGISLLSVPSKAVA